MDGSRFDTLVKALATTSLSRANVVRGLAASAAALAGGDTRHGAECGQEEEHEKAEGLCLWGGRDGGQLPHPEESQGQGQEAATAQPLRFQGQVHGVNPCASGGLHPEL